MSTEIVERAEFSQIRYAQVWEDADILLRALSIPEQGQCLSISSAGDNAIAMLLLNPKKVVALDMNPAQLACLGIRVAAYKTLHHEELLQLIGARPCEASERRQLYHRCRPLLQQEHQAFWDQHRSLLEKGIGGAGKFENYFKIFRQRILPFVHSRKQVKELLLPKSYSKRQDFYAQRWETFRWQMMFRLFFSKKLMGAVGRDAEFFKYVEGSIADKIMARAKHAFTELDPSDNSYLHWILNGTYAEVLPVSLRQENFELIRSRIDSIEWHNLTIEAYLNSNTEQTFDAYNLSDIFEYMSESNANELFATLVKRANPGAKLVYWNMMVPRQCPSELEGRHIWRNDELSTQLHREDKAFFYSAVHVNEVKSSCG